MRRVADQRQPGRDQAADALAREREDPALALDPHRAEQRARLALDLRGERGVVERGAPLRLRLAHRPDQARAIRRAGRRGQGHQRERPLAGVKLGREIVVRARVGEHDRQRALWVAAHADRNPGGAPRRRSAPVRADDERGGEDASVGERDRGALGREIEPGDVGRDANEIGMSGGRRFERVGERRVLDVPAEDVAADLARAERDRRRREQRAGVVDDPQAPHRRGARRDRRPDAELVEEIDRRAEQRDRPSLAEPLARAG